MASVQKNSVVIGDPASDLINTKVEKTIDTRSMACPYPSFETAKAVNPMPLGATVEVITDNSESALEAIPSVCHRRKYDFVVIQEDKHLWRVRVRKSR